jgi:hypothetical protein
MQNGDTKVTPKKIASICRGKYQLLIMSRYQVSQIHTIDVTEPQNERIRTRLARYRRLAESNIDPCRKWLVNRFIRAKPDFSASYSNSFIYKVITEETGKSIESDVKVIIPRFSKVEN